MEKVIQRFNQAGIKYLVIGGQCIRLLGMPRYSMDWDFFIPGKDIENINKLNMVLDGMIDMDIVPLGDKGQNFIQTFQTVNGIMQFHLAPVALPSFNEAYSRHSSYISENGITIKTISPEDLYACKLKINRPKDADDIIYLQALLKKDIQNDNR